MGKVQEPARTGKNRRRWVLDEAGMLASLAFEKGKQAAADAVPMTSNPYRSRRLSDLHEAWHRGWRFMGAHLQGLRPIDTVRVVGEPEPRERP